MTETSYSQKTLVQKILNRHGQLETLRQPYDDRFADIVDFCEPGLTSWTNREDSEGTFRGEKIYEGTPPWALRVMTDGWLGTLVSETLKWIKYAIKDPAIQGNDDINEWLQNYEEVMYSVYRSSEFYSALSPFTRAGLSVGSPIILPYEDRKTGRIRCEVPHPKENYFGKNGMYHRCYQLTVLEAVEKFLNGKLPESETDLTNSKLSMALMNDYKNGNHFNRYWFIRAIYPSDDTILNGQPKAYKNKPWMEFNIQKDASDIEQKKEPLLVQGYWTKPHIRWDYEINDDEFYARTPAWHAMMDIRSQQEFARQMLEAGQRSLNPPMWAQRKYKGHINMRPKGFTYYDKLDEYQNIPKPIQENVNYSVGSEVHDRVRQSVERWFHTDLFRQLARLMEGRQTQGSWPTATQIIYLNAEGATLLAPKIGRYTNTLREIDDRFTDIAGRMGKLPQPPDILLEYMAYKKMLGDNELRIDLEFIGTLSQMQQRGLALGRSEAGLAILKSYTELDPMLVHKVRLSVSLERDLEEVGYAQKAIVPEEEYQALLTEINNEQVKQAQTEQMMAGMETVPKLSKSIEQNSPLALLGAGAAEEGAAA